MFTDDRNSVAELRLLETPEKSRAKNYKKFFEMKGIVGIHCIGHSAGRLRDELCLLILI